MALEIGALGIGIGKLCWIMTNQFVRIVIILQMIIFID